MKFAGEGNLIIHIIKSFWPCWPTGICIPAKLSRPPEFVQGQNRPEVIDCIPIVFIFPGVYSSDLPMRLSLPGELLAVGFRSCGSRCFSSILRLKSLLCLLSAWEKHRVYSKCCVEKDMNLEESLRAFLLMRKAKTFQNLQTIVNPPSELAKTAARFLRFNFHING